MTQKQWENAHKKFKFSICEYKSQYKPRNQRKAPEFANDGTSNKVEEVEKHEDRAKDIVVERLDCGGPTF